ncbi:CAP domain-containing protein [Phaeosphaeriaceae sp. PMI808]|nr:CAP domain-containing protein [Phaeosphaeriaceae sp. PMI808]
MRSSLLLSSALALGALARPTAKATTSILFPPASVAQPSPASPNRPTGTGQAILSSGADYQAAVLYHHNAARANHGASPLTWDTACETNARIAAERCTFEHYIPQGAGQGQNLFTVSGKAFNVTAGITESWYKGELDPMMPYFGQNSIPDSVFHSVGHLTQLVWKGTTKVGCVSIDCGDQMKINGQKSSLNKYTVCNYSPAGNVGGGYANNVAAPISTTNLGGWAN